MRADKSNTNGKWRKRFGPTGNLNFANRRLLACKMQMYPSPLPQDVQRMKKECEGFIKAKGRSYLNEAVCLLAVSL